MLKKERESYFALETIYANVGDIFEYSIVLFPFIIHSFIIHLFIRFDAPILFQ